jgi:hypothetical protein
MATMLDDPQRRMSIGRVLGRTFGAIGSNPLVMLAIAFLFGALPQTLLSYFQQTLQAPLRAGQIGFGGYFGTVALVALINMMLAVVVQGGLVRATMAASEGSKATLGECLSTGLSRSLPLLGVAFLAGLGIGFGFLLLIVPGIFLLLMWSVAAPVTVAERLGVTGSLGRSAELTEGARWNILALYLIVWVIMVVASAISGAVMVMVYGLQGLATAMQGGLPIAFFVINAITATAVTLFSAAMPTSLYVELRDWKDGPQTQSLEDIFA